MNCYCGGDPRGFNRKKRLPVGALTMMNLVVPSLMIISAGATQLVVFKSAFCSSLRPAEAAGQETTTVLLEVRKMLSSGAPGVCAA